MVAQEELKRLQQRKRELIAESDAIRGDLASTFADIGELTAQWRARLQQIRLPKVLWAAGAAAAGLFLARKSTKGIGLAAKVVAGWRVFSTARDVWRGWQASRGPRS